MLGTSFKISIYLNKLKLLYSATIACTIHQNQPWNVDWLRKCWAACTFIHPFPNFANTKLVRRVDQRVGFVLSWHIFFVCYFTFVGMPPARVHLLFMFFLFVDSHVKEFLSSKMWQATRTGTIERWKAPLPAFTKAPLQQPPAAWCMNGELRCACCNWFLSKFHCTKPPPSPQVNIQISPPCQQSKTRLRNMTDKLVLVMLASFSLGDVHVHTCVDLKIAHRCELRKRA